MPYRISELLVRNWPELFDTWAFRITEDTYDEATFGDQVLVAASGQLLFRVVRDRGEFRAEVASPSEPDAWWPLADVLTVAVPGVEWPLRPAADADGAIRPLVDHLAAVAQVMSPERYPDTRRRIVKHQLERGKRIMEALQRTPVDG